VNYIREFQIAHGVAPSNAYTFTMYILVAFLAVGLVCNLAVRPLEERAFVMQAATVPPAARAVAGAHAYDGPARWSLVGVAWALAAMPLGWGVLKTLTLASQMFR